MEPLPKSRENLGKNGFWYHFHKLCTYNHGIRKIFIKGSTLSQSNILGIPLNKLNI